MTILDQFSKPGTGILLIFIFLSASTAQGQLSTVKVMNADGTPVEGASTCFGIQMDPSAYGQGMTDQWGNAQFQAALPEGPASLYVTANKNGRGVTVVRQITAAVAPLALFFEVALPGETGGPHCSTGSSGAISPASFLQGMVIDPGASLLAGHIFEIQLILDRPPPAPVPVVLEASNPRLVSLPDQVSFDKGEQKKIVKAQVSRDAQEGEYVTIHAYLERNRAQPVQKRLLIGAEAKKKAPNDRRE